MASMTGFMWLYKSTVYENDKFALCCKNADQSRYKNNAPNTIARQDQHKHIPRLTSPSLP